LPAECDSLDEFLNDFPFVNCEDAIAALELAREMTQARAAGSMNTYPVCATDT